MRNISRTEAGPRDLRPLIPWCFWGRAEGLALTLFMSRTRSGWRLPGFLLALGGRWGGSGQRSECCPVLNTCRLAIDRRAYDEMSSGGFRPQPIARLLIAETHELLFLSLGKQEPLGRDVHLQRASRPRRMRENLPTDEGRAPTNRTRAGYRELANRLPARTHPASEPASSPRRLA